MPTSIISPYFFTGRMPFLPPNQQHQSTEGDYHIRIREQTLELSSPMLPAPSPYLTELKYPVPNPTDPITIHPYLMNTSQCGYTNHCCDVTIFRLIVCLVLLACRMLAVHCCHFSTFWKFHAAVFTTIMD